MHADSLGGGAPADAPGRDGRRNAGSASDPSDRLPSDRPADRAPSGRPAGRGPSDDLAGRGPSDRPIGASEHRYTHGHGPAVLEGHARRGALDSAAYLLPRLHPGMDLLDVGCGPASITADLAEFVAPGRVVALDASPLAIEAARATLAARGLLGGVELAVGDTLALPFEDGAFDVVHAHQALQHVDDPVAALKEMRRVVRPGGTVAVRDAVYSAMSWFPQPEGMDLWLSAYMATARANGGEPDAGSRLLSWARRAGLAHVTASASSWCFAAERDRSWWSATWAERCFSSFGPRACELGLATAADLQAMAEGWRQWGASDDGWFAVVHGEILADV